MIGGTRDKKAAAFILKKRERYIALQQVLVGRSAGCVRSFAPELVAPGAPGSYLPAPGKSAFWLLPVNEAGPGRPGELPVNPVNRPVNRPVNFLFYSR